MQQIRMVRLAPDPHMDGLCCQSSGLTLAGIPLLEKEGNSFRPLPESVLRRVFIAVFSKVSDDDLNCYQASLRSVSRALNDGDVSRAMIGSLLMKLPEIDGEAAARLRKSDFATKANFNDLEPRNHGKWTTGGSGIVPAQSGAPLPLPFPPFSASLAGYAAATELSNPRLSP